MSAIINILIALVYIGTRPFKVDNVCGTGTTWHGYGDVQSVEKKYYPLFLKHPDVWMTEEDFNRIDVSAIKPDGYNADTDSFDSPSENTEVDTAKLEDENTEVEEVVSGLISVQGAILSLEDGNPLHFSSTNGVPIVSAVRDAANDQTITAAQVREAWADLNGKGGI